MGVAIVVRIAFILSTDTCLWSARIQLPINNTAWTLLLKYFFKCESDSWFESFVLPIVIFTLRCRTFSCFPAEETLSSQNRTLFLLYRVEQRNVKRNSRSQKAEWWHRLSITLYSPHHTKCTSGLGLILVSVAISEC